MSDTEPLMDDPERRREYVMDTAVRTLAVRRVDPETLVRHIAACVVGTTAHVEEREVSVNSLTAGAPHLPGTTTRTEAYVLVDGTDTAVQVGEIPHNVHVVDRPDRAGDGR